MVNWQDYVEGAPPGMACTIRQLCPSVPISESLQRFLGMARN